MVKLIPNHMQQAVSSFLFLKISFPQLFFKFFLGPKLNPDAEIVLSFTYS